MVLYIYAQRACCVSNLMILSQDDAAERRRRLPEVGGAVGAQTRGNARHRHQAQPSAPQILGGALLVVTAAIIIIYLLLHIYAPHH